jgi:hypothetical protein
MSPGFMTIFGVLPRTWRLGLLLDLGQPPRVLVSPYRRLCENPRLSVLERRGAELQCVEHAV